MKHGRSRRHAMDKQALRRQLLTARQELPSSLRVQHDEAILAQLIQLPQVQAAHTLLVYLDFRGEVTTAGLIEWGLAQGKTVCAPVSVVEERRLIPVRLDALEDVTVGAYGIREPILTEEKQVPLAEIDVVIIPGVGFDRQGGRLGYGGGYYDRFLPRLRPDALKVAVAYEQQVLPSLPLEAHDMPLDMLVTEAGVFRTEAI